MAVESLSELFMAMNDETKQHSVRVAMLCRSIAKELDMDERKAWMIGLFHDVGKTKVPLDIIEKPGRLTDQEREEINWHSYYSFDALTELGFPKDITIPILYHHGYDMPRNHTRDENVLAEDDRYIRLVGCCDVYDALTSERCYHKAIDGDKARDIISDIEELRSDEVLAALEKRENQPEKVKVVFERKLFSTNEIRDMLTKAQNVITKAGKQMDLARSEIEKQSRFIREEKNNNIPARAR